MCKPCDAAPAPTVTGDGSVFLREGVSIDWAALRVPGTASRAVQGGVVQVQPRMAAR